MDVLDDLQAALDGRYEIVRELGRGGMAVVYLARDLKHERQVAIKVLPPEMATSVGAERFTREIRTAAQLSHPNILPLHDSIAVDQVRAYVMPYVQGESLRQRLDRERQLDITLAVDIARQVAAGLDYAHAQGIVHRDIKPENILLVGDQAVIADFGLARAVFTATSAPFTQSGMAVGTPAYMSPEQGAADAVDGRTDVYALGCVFFEMVAGVPPFRGATMAALLAAHATRKPPSLCAERESCPAAMDAAVQRALAKVPADRFRTAGDFVHALETWRASVAPGAASLVPARRWMPWAVGVAALVAAAALAPSVVERVRVARTPLDSNRVLVLQRADGDGAPTNAALIGETLCSSLRRWRDLQLDGCDAGSTVAAVRSVADGQSLARRAGAATFVLASAGNLTGDSVHVSATLYNAAGAAIRQAAVHIPAKGGPNDAAERTLSSDLFRLSDLPADVDDGARGTAQLGAWRAYQRGQLARARWSLDSAEREFRQAVTLDAAYPQARLWLAQVAAWERPFRGKEWGDDAARAAASHAFIPRDSLLAEGLVELGAGRYPEACSNYRALHRIMPQSDLPWYGIAYCLAYDGAVVRSDGSPSGWKFRGNSQEAAIALDSALAHTEGAPQFAFSLLGSILIAEPVRKRRGHGIPPDTTTFYATPSVTRDSLTLIPYPAIRLQAEVHEAQATLSDALQRNIARLKAAYDEWVRRAPGSADALAALAYAQELRGEPEALETTRRARTLTGDSARRLGLDVNVVRLLVKAGHLDSAQQQASRLLRAHRGSNPLEADALSGVAALVGDIPKTTELLVRAMHDDPEAVFHSRFRPPVQLLQTASSLYANAASGICSESTKRMIGAMDRSLVQFAPADQHAELRRALMSRSLSLLVPCYGPRLVVGVKSPDLLIGLQQRLARHDYGAVRASFDAIRTARRGTRPGDIALDRTVQEAWVLLQVGDTTAAIRYLDLPLGALSTMSTHLLDDVPAAAALGRALLMRADLAAARADTVTARTNARRVLALWAGASPELGEAVRRMQSLAQQ